MKAILTSLIVILGVAGMAGSRAGITVNLKNQGDGKVSYFESQGGMLIQWPVDPETGNDSTFHISFPEGNNPEYVLFRYVKDGKYSLFPMYLTRKSGETLTIDGASENIFTSSLPEAEVKAIAASREMEQYYYDYLSGRGDPLGLRKDTVPSSVYRKILQQADSLADISKSIESLYPALRQEIYLNAYKFFNGIKARREHGCTDKAILDEWERKRAEFERTVDFRNPLNALSMSLLRIFPGIPEYNGDGSPDDVNRFKIDYYRAYYTGLNAERLEASVIFDDVAQNRFAQGIPVLYDEFQARYPQSPLLPRLKEAVDRNISVNTGINDTDITFVDNIKSVDELVARFKGSPVLVDIWASWCGPCRKSFTQLEPLRKFAAESGLKLVYISIDEEESGKTASKQIARKLGVKGTHAIAGKELHDDVFRIFGNSDGSLMIPHVALYDAQGNLMVRKINTSDNPADLITRLKAELGK